MAKSRIFKSNGSQAVRLPKAAAFPDDVGTVDVIVMGNARLLVPAKTTWSTWFDGEGVSEDFMVERDQPPDQERQSPS